MTRARLIDSARASLHDHADLQPGEVMPENVSDAGVPGWFFVSAPRAKRIGCLVALFDQFAARAACPNRLSLALRFRRSQRRKAADAGQDWLLTLRVLL